MVVMPDPDNPSEVRRFLRAMKVDFTLIHPESSMMARYRMVAPLMNIEPHEELNAAARRAFRHVYESIDVV